MITPNQLTVFRIIIALISPVILIYDRSLTSEIIVFFLFTIACVTDWWDGYLARTKSMITNFGKIMDPIADKLLIIGLLFTFAYFELFGFEWVIIILVREIAVTSARFIKLKQGKVLPAESAGKIKIGFQIGSVYAALIFMMLFDSTLFFEPEPYFLFAFQSLYYIGIFLAVLTSIISGMLFFQRYDTSK
jgi:CDP-diacylglycerol---glycerol-3-phosphate 3-phosphatidyltransferase